MVKKANYRLYIFFTTIKKAVRPLHLLPFFLLLGKKLSHPGQNTSGLFSGQVKEIVQTQLKSGVHAENRERKKWLSANQMLRFPVFSPTPCPPWIPKHRLQLPSRRLENSSLWNLSGSKWNWHRRDWLWGPLANGSAISLDSVHNQQVPPMGSELPVSVLGPYSYIWPPETEKREKILLWRTRTQTSLSEAGKGNRLKTDFEGRRKCQWKRLS